MKAFLKENSVLIIGLSLPLILALLFLVVQFFSNINIAAPQHAVLFTTGNNYSNHGHRIYVKNNQVHYAFNKNSNSRSNNNNSYYERNKPRVFVYNPINNTSKELPIPVVEDYKQNTDVVITGINAKEILTTLSSPDGYALETNRYRRGNLFTEIIGGRSYSDHIINLKKRTKRVPIEIPTSQNSYHYHNRNIRFLGWVIEE